MVVLRAWLRTTFVGALLFGAILVGAPAAKAASIGAGALFQNGERHVRFGTELPSARNELRVAGARSAGRSGNLFLGRSPRGDVAVPEPGAALLFSLGALAIARARRRA